MAPLCRVLGMPVSTLYDRVGRPAWARALIDAELAERIEKIWADSGRSYGSPRIHAALARAGIRVGRKRVERIMAANGCRERICAAAGRPPPSAESRRRRCRIWCAAISPRIGPINCGSLTLPNIWAHHGRIVLSDDGPRRVQSPHHRLDDERLAAHRLGAGGVGDGGAPS